MKRILLTITLLLLHLYLLGQSGIAPMHQNADGFAPAKDTTYVHRIEFLDGKTLEELEHDTVNYKVSHVKKYGYSILHFQLAPLMRAGEHYEYYRITDKKFRVTKFVDSVVVEEGIIATAPKPSHIDTLVQIDLLNDLKNVYTIFYYYQPIKTEAWMELDEDGQVISGFYKNNLRHGEWYLGIFCPSIRYENGKIISLFCPTAAITNKYKAFLFDKKYIYCAVQYKEGVLGFAVPVKTNPHPFCSQTLQLILKKNFEFACNGFQEENGSIQSGQGKWSISPQGELVLQYNSGQTLSYEIDAFGPSFLHLKIKQ